MRLRFRFGMISLFLTYLIGLYRMGAKIQYVSIIKIKV